MDSFAAWQSALEMRSRNTARVYPKAVLLFCREVNARPSDLPGMGERLRDLLIDYAKKKGATWGSLTVSAVKNWLEFNGIHLPYRFRLGNVPVQREKCPGVEQAESLLLHADLKTRAMVSLVAFSGVRLETIGNADGTDGLRIGDLPELMVEEKNIAFNENPAMLIVRESISKARHRYFTFIPQRGMEYILAYLRTRGALKESDPLIASRSGGFLKTESISAAIRKAMRRAELRGFRPYDLRHFFATRMLLAEAGGVIPRDYRVFWMGHRGDIEARYTLNKHILPAELVRDMRIKFELAHEMFFREGQRC
jgi:integrase